MKLVVLDRRHCKGSPKPRRRMAPSFQHLAPGSLWLDNSGNRIRAHGAGLLSHDGLYYWYGAHGYRRPDLFEGPPNRRINVYYSNSLERWNASELPAFEIDHGYVDRPKVVHSREKDLFVMWMKATPYVAVATSTSPLGPFTLRGRWRPLISPSATSPRLCPIRSSRVALSCLASSRRRRVPRASCESTSLQAI